MYPFSTPLSSLNVLLQHLLIIHKLTKHWKRDLLICHVQNLVTRLSVHLSYFDIRLRYKCVEKMKENISGFVSTMREANELNGVVDT